MKKLSIVLLSSVFYLTNVNDRKYFMNTDNRIYKDRIQIKNELKSETVVEENKKEYSYYNGSEESKIGFTDIYHGCAIKEYSDYVELYHGAYTCQTGMNGERLKYNSDSTIDISFEMRRVGYGSNYSMSMSITNLFYWRYHRSGSDYIRYAYSEDGDYKQKSNNYNSYVKYRIYYKNKTLEYYEDDILIDRIENLNIPETEDSFFRFHMNNTKFRVGNINIKIDN